MIKALLRIRYKQFFRGTIGIGLFRIVFLCALFGFLGLALFIKSADKITAQYITIVFLVIITLIQIKRRDKLFLKSHLSNYKLYILVEYILLSIPILICFFIHKQWISIIMLLGLLIIVNLEFKMRISSLNTKLQEIIPDDCIEWKAGIRRHFFVIVPIWIIAFFTSFFVGSVPIAIFVLGVSTFSFFEVSEPYQTMLTYELSSKKFIFHKVKRQFQLFTLIVLPLIALFVIFNMDRWYIPVGEYFIFCILHIYAIMTKYAFYEPNKNSPAAQVFSNIGFIAGIIPIFLPAVGLLTIWFYLKSINNLNYYLDDFD